MKFWCSKNDGEVLILNGRKFGVDLCELLNSGMHINFVIFVRGPYEIFVS